MKRSAASVKERLKNLSKASGKTMESLLVAYGLERTIYRISISKYVENFTLKGGIFLYALFDGEFARTTTDIDLLAQKIGNDITKLREVFSEIFSLDTEDPLYFDLTTLDIIPITEFKEYHGVNVSVIAYLDRTRINVSIDVGYGDIVYPGRVKMDFPVVLDDTIPSIYAYSLCSCVSEKFEAVVSLGYDNSRFKDFYDIYLLASRYDFVGKELAGAIRETFEHRRTDLNEIVAFEGDYAENPLRQTRWNAFIKKKRAMLPVTLKEAIGLIKIFLIPIIENVKLGNPVTVHWSHETLSWDDNNV